MPRKYWRTLTSKWTKTKVLLQSAAVRPYIPTTKKLSAASLEEMLNQFGMVYVKPINGTFGYGVMRVEKVEQPGGISYKYQTGTRIRTFDSFMPLYDSINKTRLKRSYLVQQGIHLLQYDKRFFDIRIMVQFNPRKKWESTGIIGRAAHPRKIVTNFHNGGTAFPIEVLMKSYLRGTELPLFVKKLNKLGSRIGSSLGLRFPGFREIGVDVGIDQKMKPWILEVNTGPDHFIFNQLKDKTMFRRIRRYAKAYTRANL